MAKRVQALSLKVTDPKDVAVLSSSPLSGFGWDEFHTSSTSNPSSSGFNMTPSRLEIRSLAGTSTQSNTEEILSSSSREGKEEVRLPFLRTPTDLWLSHPLGSSDTTGEPIADKVVTSYA